MMTILNNRGVIDIGFAVADAFQQYRYNISINHDKAINNIKYQIKNLNCALA